MRLTLAVAVACLGTVAIAVADPASASIKKHTEIPAQGLGAALTTLAKEFDFQVLYRTEVVGTLHTQGASGAMTAAEALQHVLSGTGLTYKYLDDKTVMIIPMGAPAPSSSLENGKKANQTSGGDQNTGGRDSFRLAEAAPASNLQPDSQQQATLEEVVVTATKRAETIKDVPVAVSAIGSQEILSRGLTQYSDYLNSVPGVSFQDAGPGQSQVHIRGVVANEGGGGAASVATYFGETVTSVLTIAGGKPNLRLVDVDRVEVLRGPQGTLFGANSLAGVVRIVPAAPNLKEFQVNVAARGFTTAHSSDGSYHVEGVLNLPLVQDRLALRLVSYRDDIAGYIDNVVPAEGPIDYSVAFDQLTGQSPGTTPAGTLIIPAHRALLRRDINSENTSGARAALSWQVDDRLRLDLSQVLQDVTLNSQPFVDPTVGAYAQNRAMDLISQAQTGERLNITSLVVNYDWDFASLVSASGYTDFKTIFRDDASIFVQGILGFPVPWEDRTDSQGKVFTQEVRLQSRGEGPWKWLAGLFYLDEKADFSQTVVDHSCPTCIPAFFGENFAIRNEGDPRFIKQKERSVFGEVSYDFSSRWTLGVGGRYLKEDITHLSSALRGFLVPDGFQPAEVDGKGSNSQVNPSAYLRFKPTKDMTLYLQAARGFRSPQTNQAIAYTGLCEPEAKAVGLGALTDPDTLWNYELGMKSRLADDRIGLNTAIYRQEWKGVQLPVQFTCGSGGVINGGDARGHGIEVEVNARLTHAWQLNLSASYGHNEFDKVKPNVGFAVGDRLPGAAETNGGAGLQYNFALNPTWTGFARADYLYVGSTPYQFGQVSPVHVTLDSYGLTNLRFGVQRDDLSLELFGRNITDERAVVNTIDPSQGNRQYLARPREIGVEVRYNFARSAR